MCIYIIYIYIFFFLYNIIDCYYLRGDNRRRRRVTHTTEVVKVETMYARQGGENPGGQETKITRRDPSNRSQKKRDIIPEWCYKYPLNTSAPYIFARSQLRATESRARVMKAERERGGRGERKKSDKKKRGQFARNLYLRLERRSYVSPIKYEKEKRQKQKKGEESEDKRSRSTYPACRNM